VDDAHGDELRRSEARLLEQFARGRRDLGLPGLDPSAGQFPKAAEKSGPGPLADQPAFPGRERDDRRDDVRAGEPRAPARKGIGLRHLLTGPAPFGDRAGGARRPLRPADRLAELHHGFVERAGVAPGELRLERAAESSPDRWGTDVPLLPGPPGGDAQSVRLEGHDGLTEREARHRGGDVRPDAREGLEFRRTSRERSAVPFDDELGGLPQVASAGVVPRPFPRLQDFALGGSRQGGHGGELSGEGNEPVRHRGDPGLLEQHLRDPDPVRVPVGPPRKGPGVGAVPPDEPPGASRRPGPPTAGRRRHGTAGRYQGLNPASV
jgi:hypothetical protein